MDTSHYSTRPVTFSQLLLYYYLPNNIHSAIRLFADDWQMHFNPQKCFVMRLTHARHLTRFNYILGDKSLQETDNHPYLGVHITKDLTWSKHIHQITATANRTLVRRNVYSFRNVLKNLPIQLLTTTKRMTGGFHTWKYIPIYSQHLQMFILTPHNNRLEYSVTPLSCLKSQVASLQTAHSWG